MAIDETQLKDLMNDSMKKVGVSNSPTSRRRHEVKKSYAVMLKPSFRQNADLVAEKLGLSFSEFVEKAIQDYLDKQR